MPSDPKYSIKTSTLTGIANAIRAKTGGSSPIDAEDFATEIAAIPSGATLTTKSITANGTYNASSDNADGYSSVSVNVDSYAAFRALADRSITAITSDMLAGVTAIADQAFSYCPYMTSVVIPDSVLSLGNGAFSYSTSSATSATVTIGDGVTTIGQECFRNNTKITTVEVGSAVASIGVRAFYGCSGLQKFTIHAVEPPTIEATTFTNASASAVFEVPAESVNAYKTATNWSAYADRIQAIPS